MKDIIFQMNIGHPLYKSHSVEKIKNLKVISRQMAYKDIFVYI